MNKTTRLAEIPTSVATAPVDPPRAALLLDGVSHAYGRILAVDDVSLSVAAGEIVALVGHSGSGKSTLLRIAAGLEAPLSGRVFLDGFAMNGPEGFVLPERRGVGFMFQDYALFPHMTVLENVMFGLKGDNTAPRRDIARHFLRKVGLSVVEDGYPHMLSGGEQQRVALARALAPRPHIVLMDEPFSNLDRGTRDDIRDETIAVLRDSGAAAILVTHDPEDAMRTADRIVLMRGGRTVQSGTIEELYRRPASLFVARFFSEFNEIDGVCRDGWVTTPVGVFRAAGFAEGARVTICVRPHDVRVAAEGSDGTLPGTVLSRRFLGESVLIRAAIDGLVDPFRIRLGLQAAAALGDRFGVTIIPEEVLVFPAPDGNGKPARAGR
jgi:iron(III) transport system ATP-binding protein